MYIYIYICLAGLQDDEARQWGLLFLLSVKGKNKMYAGDFYGYGNKEKAIVTASLNHLCYSKCEDDRTTVVLIRKQSMNVSWSCRVNLPRVLNDDVGHSFPSHVEKASPRGRAEGIDLACNGLIWHMMCPLFSANLVLNLYCVIIQWFLVGLSFYSTPRKVFICTLFW